MEQIDRFFVARFDHFVDMDKARDMIGRIEIDYSNGMSVKLDEYRWAIDLGEIVAKGNLK